MNVSFMVQFYHHKNYCWSRFSVIIHWRGDWREREEVKGQKIIFQFIFSFSQLTMMHGLSQMTQNTTKTTRFGIVPHFGQKTNICSESDLYDLFVYLIILWMFVCSLGLSVCGCVCRQSYILATICCSALTKYSGLDMFCHFQTQQKFETW